MKKYNCLLKTKIVPSQQCRVCQRERKLKCGHLCEECIYILKKYFPYKGCPYCYELLH